MLISILPIFILHALGLQLTCKFGYPVHYSCDAKLSYANLSYVNLSFNIFVMLLRFLLRYVTPSYVVILPLQNNLVLTSTVLAIVNIFIQPWWPDVVYTLTRKEKQKATLCILAKGSLFSSNMTQR